MHVNPFSSSKAHQDGLDLGQNKEMEKTYLQIQHVLFFFFSCLAMNDEIPNGLAAVLYFMNFNEQNRSTYCIWYLR